MMRNVTDFLLMDDGEIPNNPELPVLVYEGAFKDKPEDIEAAFNRNGWTNSWVNGVFDYHHFHTNTHEVLGVRAGEAVVLIGGEQGERLELKTGDVLVLPAGTGHKRLRQSPEFSVVGAYPDGRSPNLKKRLSTDFSQEISEIKEVPLPEQDPVYGTDGPLIDRWKQL